MRLPNIIERIRRWMVSYGTNEFSRATEDDIYFGYRLLLDREPDEMGLAYWRDLVNNHHIPVHVLTDALLSSTEFKALQSKRSEPQLIELSHFKLYVRPNDYFIGMAIARERRYEPYVTAEIRRLLAPGNTFVDVGANIGYFTMLAAHLVGPAGHVVAFEPKPDNCELLRRSLSENGFEQVRLFPVAVAETSRAFTFSSGGADSNARIMRDEEVADQDFALPTFEAVTLDETLADEERIDLIKMDIEGAEPRAWQGMQKIVKRYQPTLILEFSPAFIRTTSGSDPRSFAAALTEVYDLHILQRDGGKRSVSSVGDLIQTQERSGLGHLDLVGYPRRRAS